MKKSEALELLHSLGTAISHGRHMISTIQPFDDPVDIFDTKDTYEEGRHDGYLIGLHDGIEASMGLIEHFQDLVEGDFLEGFKFED